MRISLLPAVWVLALVLAGCVREKQPAPQPAPVAGTPPPAPATPPATPPTDEKLIVTASNELSGRVSSVNGTLRFVVLTFPIGQMPAQSQHLSLYRRGLKVGEVNITGPQRDDSIVADIISGEAAAGDEAKEK